MRWIAFLFAFTFTTLITIEQQSAYSEQTDRETLPKAIEIKLTDFKPPSQEERGKIEQWLLELDLVPMIADRVAFTATGTYFFAGKGKEAHIANLRQYAIGWSLDNREDRERLLVINQQLLNPDVIDQGKWRLMQSDTSQLDRLRLKSTYHEANGSKLYEPGPKSKIQGSLEGSNTFFPTRAATSSPISCWSGQAMDRSEAMVTIDKLQGVQPIGKHTVALFEFHPADFYVYFVGLAFLDGAPVQCDGWRQFRRAEDLEHKSPTPEQVQAERDYNLSNATRVARVQSKWTVLGTQSVPIFIQGSTLNDFYDVELVSSIQWFVNDQVNPAAFDVQSVRQLGPFSVVAE